MWPDATPSPPPLPRAPRAECEAATEMCLFMVPIGTAPLKGIVLLGTQRGRDLVLWRRGVGRRNPTPGGGLGEGGFFVGEGCGASRPDRRWGAG